MTSVSLAEALRLMKNELDAIDTQFATQFGAFRTNILTLEQKVKSDKEIFNSSRRQSTPSGAVGGNYYGRQYERQVGGRLGATKHENEFAYLSGVSRYV